MNTVIRAAFAAFVLTATAMPLAHAASWGRPATTIHQGPYDNTANSLGGSNFIGGGGSQ